MPRPAIYDYEKVWEILKGLHDKGLLDYGYGKKSIKKHLQLPSNASVSKNFGTIKEIREKIDKGLDYEQAKIDMKKIKDICRDCVFEISECGRSKEDCEEEATLYNELGDKNTVAEYLGAADFQINNG